MQASSDRSLLTLVVTFAVPKSCVFCVFKSSLYYATSRLYICVGKKSQYFY